ncbi:Phenylalanyl-tRNA synthetase, beta chain [Paracholeplasma brassicae]|uniref:Phenylalanine--tRNA ligase beta subunit n=1 Tax=Acholeplasma brassicae TaxID=61635 RepID=U4KMT0_9MOLU|nr:phenylalanine--tRNA ligase subunit beta [Paracholeplasma brassicae]CCV65537.1 Phenylalanyl-tRNA synthetase, beta chain [Paracholeplasma brassicae]
MKIATNLLKNFINPVPENLYELTNQYITEVESYQTWVSAKGIVTGKVLTCVDHENSDHLHVTTVDFGDGEVDQIVCGAKNVAAGQYVVVARPGAVLPGDFVIKHSKIRGVESNGMICSLRELGIEDKYVSEKFKDGIYYFEQDVPLGVDPRPYLGLDQDTIELSLTPNRADLLSVLGFAHDLGAVLEHKVVYEEKPVVESDELNPVVVKLDTDKCTKYYARHVSQVVVRESPEWLRGILIASGIRPINNVVDVTNYVLLELGTPLHAFDAKKLRTNKIVVRNAKEGEEIITLDDVKRSLTQDDILITNGEVPICLAGVMGLSNTAVDFQTTEVIFEAASFDKNSIRRTSKRLDLRSDSSLRFERGIDETRLRLAINRAASLLQEITMATVSKEITFVGTAFQRPTRIELTLERVNKTLGINLKQEELYGLLKRLNIMHVSNQVYLIPTYRDDLKIEADLIEEVARIYGYNNIPMTLPKEVTQGKYTFKQKNIIELRKQLRALGFNEVINYSLLPEESIHLFCPKSEDIIKLLHPMSDDRKVLRHSLINGLYENVVYHESRQFDNLKFFEIGRKYFHNEEPTYLGMILTGDYIESNWQKRPLGSDFFLLKGMVEKLFSFYEITPSFEKTTDIDGFHPGIQAKITYQKQTLGYIGKLHPKLESDAVAVEFNLDLLFKLVEKQSNFKTISKYPAITRDIAFVVDKHIETSKIEALIVQTARKFLTDIKLFDVYMDEKIGTDKKSLAYTMTFNSVEKTLETQDIDKIVKSIFNRLQFEFKAEVRS